MSSVQWNGLQIPTVLKINKKIALISGNSVMETQLVLDVLDPEEQRNAHAHIYTQYES